jgi:hypothetical protein
MSSKDFAEISALVARHLAVQFVAFGTIFIKKATWLRKTAAVKFRGRDA